MNSDAMNPDTMNPNAIPSLEPVAPTAHANPWLPTPPADTSWLDAVPAATSAHDGGFQLSQLVDGSLPLQAWINDGLGWVVAHCRPFFQAVRAPIDATLSGVSDVLLAVPAPAVIAIVGLLAWQFTSRALAIGTVLALLVVAGLGVWPEAMVTLSLVLTSLAFCLAIGFAFLSAAWSVASSVASSSRSVIATEVRAHARRGSRRGARSGAAAVRRRSPPRRTPGSG